MQGKSFLKSYGLSLVLLASVAVGSALGLLLGPKAAVLKPFGDVFLNLLYVSVVPLVFFTIASAVAGMAGTGRLFKVLAWMLVVFTVTGAIASGVMVVGVKTRPAPAGDNANPVVSALTVDDFPQLITKKHLLPLIVFAVLVGLATSAAGEKGKPFAAFLASGNEVFLKIISLLMVYAPIGLAACFAAIVGADIGPALLGAYARVMILYYPVCIAYFFVAFTLYAFLAAGRPGVRRFWGNIFPATAMAVGSCSSFATIPLNLQAADRVGVPRDISEVVIPIGAQIHMDGSCLAAIVKIAFLAGLYGLPLETAGQIGEAVVVAILAGMVMSGIPGGGFTGELLIVTMYGLPPEALVLINTIGTLVDPPATAVNAVGDNVAGMLVARILGGRGWLRREVHSS
ncbi:MAG: dicarboxylate/amino acid:cation symporter [Planctomycetota bacterium]|nr:dicarboxylate/amino acid:cation symporter [Planctomycetota bacterium]